MVEARITRSVRLPDALRVARNSRAPELGPRVLFFSGGSALRPLSRALKQYTHNSVHLITAFDSGGSSAKLRQAFQMPAIGDLRNRIVALADESVRGNPQIYRLFSHRLSATDAPKTLDAQLTAMVRGSHPLVADIPEPMRQIVRTHLRFFAERRPSAFDLRGANIGNLLLAGGFLANSRDLDSVLFLFSKLLEVRGIVRPIVDADLHLCAHLSSDERVVGQHALTGRETPPIQSPVRDLRLVSTLADPVPAQAAIGDNVRRLIESADLICFPMGSFYSSVVANLLPGGVGQALASAGCPKVYIPNTAADSEQHGLSIADSVERLVEFVRRDAGSGTPVHRILDLVLLDQSSEHYAMPVDVDRIARLGVEVVHVPLITEQSQPRLDPNRLVEMLLSLA